MRRPGAGSALLEDPVRAAEIMAAVAENSRLPVSAKIRLGPSRDITEDLVPRLVKAGAQAITLHARTTRQGFGGRADWGHPAPGRLVPRAGYRQRRRDQRARRGAHAGRDRLRGGDDRPGAMGDPWIFTRALARLEGREPSAVTPAMKRRALAEHLELAKQLGGEGHALHFVRQFMMWYSRGLPGASQFRRAAGPAGS